MSNNSDAGDRGDTNQLFDVAFRDLPFGIRLYTTSLARIFPSLGLSGADVYATMLIGEEFYGTVKLDSLPARIIVKDVGSSGVYDPLDQVGAETEAHPKLRKFTQRPMALPLAA